ncbi:MAG TPA: DUF2071 domain-containing protein [Tepidisphaeraceae bacterium]|jgi:hypothetical protein|nr:DUF2071 domain-containing protein [Tepidisphaeraceae bacterium]
MPEIVTPTADRSGPWVMHMRWRELLFMHWPIPADLLRPMIPPPLELDTFAGSAWLGIVPFVMSDVRLRGSPAIPGAASFPELNVRTYVTLGDRPGVWFFSLDAASRVAVRAARLLWHLPYFDARMSATADDHRVEYQSTRTHRHAPPARLMLHYRPVGVAQPTTAGSLEYFLTARFCLYSATRRGQVFRGDVDHAPWPLQPAEADIQVNGMTEQIGISLPPQPPLLHFSRSLDVVAWRIRKAAVGTDRRLIPGSAASP